MQSEITTSTQYEKAALVNALINDDVQEYVIGLTNQLESSRKDAVRLLNNLRAVERAAYGTKVKRSVTRAEYRESMRQIGRAAELLAQAHAIIETEIDLLR